MNEEIYVALAEAARQSGNSDTDDPATYGRAIAQQLRERGYAVIQIVHHHVEDDGAGGFHTVTDWDWS